MKTILLNRLKDDGVQTIGRASLLNDYLHVISFSTLELAYKDNQKNISCIPCGEYTVKVRKSAKYGRHLHVQDVENRTYILFHWGNFNKDTNGCILTGRSFAHIDNDGLLDVTDSRHTFKSLMSFIDDEDELKLVITKPLL